MSTNDKEKRRDSHPLGELEGAKMALYYGGYKWYRQSDRGTFC